MLGKNEPRAQYVPGDVQFMAIALPPEQYVPVAQTSLL
jgi:hypothetical protein